MKKSRITLAFLLLSVLALTAPSFNGATCVGASCVDPPPSLEAWWPGDGEATDIVGENDGTLMGDTTYTEGIVGDAFSFDGDGDKVIVPHDDSLHPAEQITIDAWINPTSYGMYDPVVTKAGGEALAGYILEFLGDHIFFGIVLDPYPIGAIYNSPTAYIEPGVWTHVAGVYDGNYIRLYVNGVEVDGATYVPGSIRYDTNELNIGGHPVFPDRFFTGLIDEVDVFSRALTAEEIASIYQAGSDGKCRPADVFTVGIDIVPGSDSNFLKVNGHGSIEVAVLGSDEFNVNEIVISSLRFEGLEVLYKGNNSPQCSVENVGGDDLDDLLCRFADDGTWQPEDDGSATLTGELEDGTLFEGADEYRLR